MTIFLVLFLSMFAGDAACWWLSHRALGAARPRAFWQILNAGFFVFQVGVIALVVFSRVQGWYLAVLDSRLVLAPVYLWHLICLPLCLFALVIFGLIRIVSFLALRRSGPKKSAAEEESRMDRRRFLALTAGAAPAVLCAGTTVAGLFQLEQFRFRRMTLNLAQLPRQLDGLTIAHVTDLHVGRFTNGAVLERIVKAINDLRADLILQTGDLINYDLRDLPQAIELVQRMRAAHGVFLCEGNHDLIENGPEFVERVKRAGIRLLVNEEATLRIRGADLQLLGLRWGGTLPTADRAARYRDAAIGSSMEELQQKRHGDVFPVLLAHHPHAFDYADGIPLTLAGHTHGGQLMLTDNFGCGPAMFRYWSGMYRREERTLVVSNGVGNWLPLRTRAPAEIVHLTLRSV